LLHPRGTRSLPEILAGKASVAIVTPDITRPLPTARILSVLLPLIEESGMARHQVTLINGTGSHRGNTPEELAVMYGPEVASQYRAVNHDAYRREGLVPVGRSAGGTEVWLNREFCEAEVKIVLGLIEPHFFAGFSGGAKGIYPAIAGIDAIMDFHNADQIGHPLSTWGVLDGNPHQKECQSVWNLVNPDFLLNVTINDAREITGIFAGSLSDAFFAGTQYAREVAMTPVAPPGFDLVVTTNSGYPLDQNLYQTVKGLSAAAKVLRPGGAIVCAAECRDGFPEHGEFRALMEMANTPAELLQQIRQPGFRRFDQWEAQTLAAILAKAEVWLFSSMDPASVERAMIHPVRSVEDGIAEALKRLPSHPRIGILPEGPMTIPYLA
jgi:nickel-dependent lactate racemase